MKLCALMQLLETCPLVASVQAGENSPLQNPQTLELLAWASLNQGVRILRLEGVENIRLIRQATAAPTIGLIKKHYPGSEVYITPTRSEVTQLIELGCEVIALDATSRKRPDGQELPGLIEQIHHAGKLAMGDCDTARSAEYAIQSSVDLLSTTLSGYTKESLAQNGAGKEGPDLEFLRETVRLGGIPVLAEGRYAEPWQVQTALRIGARGVVVGAALNDPSRQTKRFLEACAPVEGNVMAVDMGGTWLRFGLFSPRWELLMSEQAPLPRRPTDRLAWIKERIAQHQPCRLGVSIGGTVDPKTGLVWEAKPTIPGHIGTEWNEATFSIPTFALNDGLVTAWGHACLPEFAGKSVLTLALGTGVGCGWVHQGRLMMGARGEYPRLNDLTLFENRSCEELLGGFMLSANPSPVQKAQAQAAFEAALNTLQALCMPDAIVLCGGVGLAPWLAVPSNVVRSAFGSQAGLYGAAALTLFPL